MRVSETERQTERERERETERERDGTHTLHKLMCKAEQKSQLHVRKSISMGNNAAEIKPCSDMMR